MEPDTYDDKPEASPQHTLRRACDPCRARKIRCNREDPCSRCITTKIECTHSDTAPREKRTRILLTPQYEKKIDRIDGRLQAVIGLLQDLKTNPSPSNPQTTHHAPTVQSCAPSPGNYTTPPTSTVIEGESSLTAHCAFANDFVQQAAGAEPLQCSTLDMQETLEALSRVVDALKKPARPSIGGRELPPFQNALTVIRLAKAQRLAGSGWIYEFLLVRQFLEICLNVYFSEDYSETDVIIVNAGLHSLFWDYSNQADAEEKGIYLEYANLCRENLETALASLPLQLPATSDFIVALLFGAWHAIELSKPSLSWTLCSKASELCHTLGYHRATSMHSDAPDEVEFKKFLFWSVYFIEKCLSLRLGRPSTMPDWDITISRPSTTDTHQHSVLAYFVLWIESARCQGNIYELLYSADAMSQPDDVRGARVELLVSDLANLQKATQETNEKWIETAKERSGEDLMDFYYISDDVLRLSLLTLIYRAAPREPGASTAFSPSCLDAARAALTRHQDCMAVVSRAGGTYLSTYVHWTLLFSPFIPFIVLFCHIIEARDQTDLERLGTLGVQRGFVQSMGSDFAQGELDMSGANPGDGQGLINPMMRMGNGAELELEHWLYNNQAMWALMEKPDFLPPRQG
ncbi:Zn(2)-C6 fungal-type domain-containing protein [Fusarium sp. LHS14.1]|nr:Zn(2)-C6 fungal-type domain-containing protein [Fusarium sp. LHS14.1]